jgi:copper(I)-binding protein
MMTLRLIFTLAFALMASASGFAHEYTAGSLHIEHPYARATVPGQPTGAAYLGIENKGKSADRLIAIASPIAKTAELHSMSMENNVMKMREVPYLDIKPSMKITMKPGDGYHIMLIGLKQPLKVGGKFPLTLKFEKAGKVDVSVFVEDNNAPGRNAGEHHH